MGCSASSPSGAVMPTSAPGSKYAPPKSEPPHATSGRGSRLHLPSSSSSDGELGGSALGRGGADGGGSVDGGLEEGRRTAFRSSSSSLGGCGRSADDSVVVEVRGRGGSSTSLTIATHSPTPTGSESSGFVPEVVSVKVTYTMRQREATRRPILKAPTPRSSRSCTAAASPATSPLSSSTSSSSRGCRAAAYGGIHLVDQDERADDSVLLDGDGEQQTCSAPLPGQVVGFGEKSKRNGKGGKPQQRRALSLEEESVGVGGVGGGGGGSSSSSLSDGSGQDRFLSPSSDSPMGVGGETAEGGGLSQHHTQPRSPFDEPETLEEQCMTIERCASSSRSSSLPQLQLPAAGAMGSHEEAEAEEQMSPRAVKKETRFGVEAETLVFDPSAALVNYCSDVTWLQWRGPVPTNFFEPEPCGGAQGGGDPGIVIFEGSDGQLYEEHPPDCACGKCGGQLDGRGSIVLLENVEDEDDGDALDFHLMQGGLAERRRGLEEEDVEVTEDEVLQEERRLSMDLQHELMGENSSGSNSSASSSMSVEAPEVGCLSSPSPLSGDGELAVQVSSPDAAAELKPRATAEEVWGGDSREEEEEEEDRPLHAGAKKRLEVWAARGDPEGTEMGTSATLDALLTSSSPLRTASIPESLGVSSDVSSRRRTWSPAGSLDSLPPGAVVEDPQVLQFSHKPVLHHTPEPLFTGPIAQQLEQKRKQQQQQQKEEEVEEEEERKETKSLGQEESRAERSGDDCGASSGKRGLPRKGSGGKGGKRGRGGRSGR